MVTNMWSGVIKNQDWKVQYDHIYDNSRNVLTGRDFAVPLWFKIEDTKK